jgi:hypothetical protein
MATLARYRKIIETVLRQYAGKPSHGEIEAEIATDGKKITLNYCTLAGMARGGCMVPYCTLT